MGLALWARWMAWMLFFGVALHGGSGGPETPRRIFRMDLRPLGAIGLANTAWEEHPPDVPYSLSFLDDSTLAVSFTISNPRAVLSTRSNPQGGSHLFHTVVMDLQSGRVLGERSWGTAHDRDRLLAITPDRFLLCLRDKLAIVSRDLKEEREHRFGKRTREQPPAVVWVTAGLKIVFLVTRLDPHHEHVQVLATESLSRLYEFKVESVGLDAVSNSSFAYMLPAKKGYALFVLPLAALEKENPPALDPVYFTQDDGCIRPFFVADDLLVLTGSCDSLRLIGTDGRIRAKQGLGGSFAVLPAGMSRSGLRFAVDVFPGWVGPYKTEGTPDPIVVYETASLMAVSEFELEPYSDAAIPRQDYALSPDGSRLAVLQGFSVTVYQLPSVGDRQK